MERTKKTNSWLQVLSQGRQLRLLTGKICEFWNFKMEMLKETEDRVYAEIEQRESDFAAPLWVNKEVQH